MTLIRFLLATKHRRRSLLLVVVITMTILLANYRWRGLGGPWKTLLDSLEMKTIDWRFQQRGERAAPPDVVIAAIDDESLQQEGRWPWRREKLADLTRALHEAGARAIVYDVFLTEPQGPEPADAASDAAFAAASRESGNVHYAWIGRGEPGREIPAERMDAFRRSAWSMDIAPDAIQQLKEFDGATPPLTEFIDGARALGYGNVGASDDGVFRWYILAMQFEGQVYPSLALSVAAADLGIDPKDIEIEPNQYIRLGQQGQLPLIGNGAVFLDFLGPTGTIPHKSVTDILDGHVEPGEIAGKIVIVGETAQGRPADIRGCPLDSEFYGVELQATAIVNLLEQRAMRLSTGWADMFIALGFGLVLGLLLTLVRPGYGVVVSALAFGAYNYGCLVAFSRANYLLPMAAPNVAIIAIVLAILIYRLSTEERHRNQITATFGLFVPPEVVSSLTAQDARVERLGAERRHITVLFADVRDFTAYSEHNRAEEVVALLNRYFSMMHDVVWEFGGTLDKYMGDGLMAFFGAPTVQEDHAERAVQAAVEMQRRIAVHRDEWAAFGLDHLRVGMGLHVGEVLVGLTGSKGRMQYTCMGDVVNLASRLEEATRDVDADIIISEALRNVVKDLVPTEPIGWMPIRGLSTEVMTYAVRVDDMIDKS